MTRIQLEAVGLEFEEAGNTVWVQGAQGTLLRIKCSGQIRVKPCTAPGAHADALIAGDLEFCVPSAGVDHLEGVVGVEGGLRLMRDVFEAGFGAGVERGYVTADDRHEGTDQLEKDDLASRETALQQCLGDLRETGRLVREPAVVELVTIAEVERCHIQRVLVAVGGNKTQASRILGITRRSLYRRLAGPRSRTGRRTGSSGELDQRTESAGEPQHEGAACP